MEDRKKKGNTHFVLLQEDPLSLKFPYNQTLIKVKIPSNFNRPFQQFGHTFTTLTLESGTILNL
jgi:hypothetical protein